MLQIPALEHRLEQYPIKDLRSCDEKKLFSFFYFRIPQVYVTMECFFFADRSLVSMSKNGTPKNAVYETVIHSNTKINNPLKNGPEPDTVAHACNPSTLES